MQQTNTMDLIDMLQSSIFLKRFRKVCESLPISNLGKGSIKVLDKMRQEILRKAGQDAITSIKIQEDHAKKYGFYIYGLITEKQILSLYQLM